MYRKLFYSILLTFGVISVSNSSTIATKQSNESKPEEEIISAIPEILPETEADKSEETSEEDLFPPLQKALIRHKRRNLEFNDDDDEERDRPRQIKEPTCRKRECSWDCELNRYECYEMVPLAI